ncbi:DUF4344 domain-containing metallopeptidase [Vibrio hepatarius]|uniref:DUF4344 domain-containing metallopeptidase n=1 Tax=Vibrio hepatarius TaxID=171383 RepID=UPI00142D7A01|nr:DUF4344 domain-containing metallopeptidase [Vibrio hepatarius]NIY83100.1 hypothetical protein [Vibrio hepatarius]
MKKITTLFIFFACSGQVFAKGGITIEMQKPQTAQEQQTASIIKASEINQTFTKLSSQYFPFNRRLRVQYGSSEGPYYDPENHSIHIPYSFYLESHDYFSKHGYEEKYGKSAEDGATDALLHTLLHEAGHAYIEDQRIPVLGKEEDAVDNFATIILLNYIENGDDVAISAADMFAFESQSEERPNYYEMGDYADEHSFDLQRYFSTLCLVYGSNPKKYQYLLDEVEDHYLGDRKDFCVSNFEIINENWHQYLSVKK